MRAERPEPELLRAYSEYSHRGTLSTQMRAERPEPELLRRELLVHLR